MLHCKRVFSCNYNSLTILKCIMTVKLGLIYNKLIIWSFKRFHYCSQHSQFLCESTSLPGVIVKGSFCNEDTCMVSRSTFFFSLFPSTMRLFSAKDSFLKHSILHYISRFHCSDSQYDTESLQLQTKNVYNQVL